jgi:hypothetical protein
MKHVLISTVLAVLMLSALFASTASGAVTFLLAEWLIGGEKLTTSLAVEGTGEINLIDTNAGGLGIRVEVLCSGIGVGTIGPNGAGEVTEFLNLAKEAIGLTPLTGLALTCTNSANCTEPLGWAAKLPWKNELVLMEDGTESFFANLTINAGDYVECLILGVSVDEECSASVGAIKVTNESGGVDGELSDPFQELAELKLGACGGRAETAILEGLGTLVPDAGTLTASSEG